MIDNTIKGPQFSGINSFMKLSLTRELQDVEYAIIGITSKDLGYRDVRYDISDIRKMSMTLRNTNLNLNVNVKTLKGVDYGDLELNVNDMESSLMDIDSVISRVCKFGVIPVTLGGDHLMLIGKLRAIVKVHGPVALILLDAHLDYELNSKSITRGSLLNILMDEKLIDIEHSVVLGIRGTACEDDYKGFLKSGVRMITAKEIKDIGIENLASDIAGIVGNHACFLSMDISFVEPTFTPGASNIAIGGPSVYETLKIIREIGFLDYKGFEIAEYMQANDKTQRTAVAIGNIVHEFLAIIAKEKNIKELCYVK